MPRALKRTKICFPECDISYFDNKRKTSKTTFDYLVKAYNHKAATLESMFLPNVFPLKALDTAEFVEHVNQLFDSFNGSSTYATYKGELKCSVSRISAHELKWDKCYLKFAARHLLHAVIYLITRRYAN